MLLSTHRLLFYLEVQSARKKFFESSLKMINHHEGGQTPLYWITAQPVEPFQWVRYHKHTL